MTTLRAVFWDVDGTLADTEMDGHRPAFNQAFADLGLAWHWDSELYSRLLAIPGGSRRVEAYAKEMKTVLTVEQLDRLRVQKRWHYLERIRQGCVGWRPGVQRLLFELDDAGLQQWIVTSSGAASVCALLEHNTTIPTFTGVVTADDVSAGKPDPEGYRLALCRSGVNAGEAVVVEDSAAGLAAAKAAGLRCLLTPSSWDRELQDAASQASAVVDHLGEQGLPAQVVHGPPCSGGRVTLKYLQCLPVEPT